MNTLIDEREGTIVCTCCGLVVDEKIYNFYDSNLSSKEEVGNDCFKNDVREILSKLQLPDVYTTLILKNFQKETEQKRNKKQLLPYVIYKTLNENGIPISIKDISSISGFTDISIYDMQESNKSLILQPSDLLEKYCRYLGMDYKTYTLIKKLLPQENISGHNPLTIIAATIYRFCKSNNIKVSMKKISSTVKISCVSIQRYLKNIENKK